MRSSARIEYTITVVILLLSLLSWLFLLKRSSATTEQITVCSVDFNGTPSKLHAINLTSSNSVMEQIFNWIVMVIAMMLIKLILPIKYIFQRSLKTKRFLSAVLFVCGYVGIWILAGLIMNISLYILNWYLPDQFFIVGIILIVTLLWQFSPIKQKFLNRGHEHKPLAVFGWCAYRDAFRFGLMHGVSCVGSGWALMILPLIFSNSHHVVMLVITFIMISEHLEHPSEPRWQLNFRMVLLKIIIAQTIYRLKPVLKFKE